MKRMALVNQDYKIDKVALCSIFTAESPAILAAVNIYKSKRGKFIICTDSLSSGKAIMNVLIRNPAKLKIMWIPSHVGIICNEKADEAATSATK